MRKYYLITNLIVFFFLLVQGIQAKTYTSTIFPWPASEYGKLFEMHCEKEGINLELKFFSTTPDWVKASSSGRFDFTIMWLGNGLSSFWGEDNPRQVAITPIFHDFGSTAILARKGFAVEEITLGHSRSIGVEFRSLVNYGMLYSLFNPKKINFRQLIAQGIVELSNDDLISNLQVGRLKMITATGEDVKKLTNVGYEVLTSSKDHVDLTTGMIWMPEKTFYKTDKKILRKIVKASILAARDMRILSYKALKKIILGDPRIKSLPIIASSYESEENFREYRNNVIWYTPSTAKARAMQFPVILKQMITLQKEIGNDITASYEQIIKFDDFFREVNNMQEMSGKK